MAATAGAKLVQPQGPRASPRSPMWVQDPQELNCPSLLPQAISSELNWKLSHQHWNQHLYGMPALQVEAQLTAPGLQLHHTTHVSLTPAFIGLSIWEKLRRPSSLTAHLLQGRPGAREQTWCVHRLVKYESSFGYSWIRVQIRVGFRLGLGFEFRLDGES